MYVYELWKYTIISLVEQEYIEMEVMSDISGRQSVDQYAEWRDVLKHVLLDESQLVLLDCLGEGT